jgi:RHS repeat-associated protein
VGQAIIYGELGEYDRALGLLREVLAQTSDWDQIKQSSYWNRELRRRMEACPQQAPETQCGPAALALACTLAGRPTSAREVAALVRPDPRGATMQDLLRAAQARGLPATGVRLTAEQLAAAPKPAIAYTAPGHYVVVTRANGEGVQFLDPGAGAAERVERWPLFNALWNGETILLARADPGRTRGILGPSVLAARRGKICWSCPPSNLGDANENFGTAFDTIPSGTATDPWALPRLAVNTANLNLVVQVVDFAYTGRGPAVYLKRTYNADDPRDDAGFGRSWTSNYHTSVSMNPDGSLDVRRGSGRVDHYGVDRRTGQYTPPPRVYDVLSKNRDGSYSLQLSGAGLTQEFDARGRLTRIVNRNGQADRLGYDSRTERLISITDAADRVTVFEYGSDGRITAVRDPAGGQVRYEYDASGNLVRTADMAGHETRFTYDRNSYLVAVTTARGTTRVDYEITPDGYALKSIVDAVGQARQYGAYRTRYQTQVSGPGGIATVFESSFEGQTRRVTDPEGRTSSFGYDTPTSRAAVTDRKGRTMSLVYDARGNLVRLLDPAGNAVNLEYDAAGNLIRLTDPLGRIYGYQYDRRGNLVERNDPEGGRVQWSYDDRGQLSSLTDALNNRTGFRYDRQGNLTEVARSGAVFASYEYDAVGRVTSYTPAEGGTVRFSYDGRGRLEQILYPGGESRRYRYDCCALREAAGPEGAQRFEYDALNRLTRFSDARGQTLEYAYESGGRLRRLVYPGGKAVNYEYDRAGRLIRVTDWLGHAMVYSYDAAGQLLTAATSGGVSTAYVYDAEGRLAGTSTFTSDGRLLGGAFYQLDGAGNRVAISTLHPESWRPGGPGEQRFTYGAYGRLLSDGQATYEYDGRGNLARIRQEAGEAALRFDLHNRLVEASAPGQVTRYEYDALGRRVGRTANSVVTRYLIDSHRTAPRVVAETDGEGNITAYYVYGLGLDSKVSSDGRAFFYHFGEAGSTVAITDASGQVVNQYSYDPFGSGAAKSERIANPFRFSARYGAVDDDDGRIYLGGRYYSPALDRFLSENPLLLATGGGPYVYAGNNPLNWAEPRGQPAPEWVPGTPPSCEDEFAPCDAYVGGESQCLCRCAAGDPWSQAVKGCLLEAHPALSSSESLWRCAAQAWQNQPAPLGTLLPLLGCYAVCNPNVGPALTRYALHLM